MLTNTKRLLLAATLIVAVLIPATAGSTTAPTKQTSDVFKTSDPQCPRGMSSVKEYRRYSSRVYVRTQVRRVAHVKLAYMKKCQRSEWATGMVNRYHKRFKQERYERKMAARVFPVRAALASIARCESGGNIRAVSPDGRYRGKYQFSFSTWASVGGSGDPAAASEFEQDRRADILYRTGGPGHWPVCQGAH